MSKDNSHKHPDEVFLDDEDLISIAGDYFSSDFPNPARTGCPQPEEIENVVKVGQTPGDDLGNHLLQCSECFNLYRTELAARARNEATATSLWRQVFGFVAQRPLASAVALAVFVAFGAALIYFLPVRQQPLVTVKNSGAQSPNPLTDERVPGSPGAINEVIIDFDREPLFRGDKQGPEQSAQVATTRPRFLITLPHGSPAGEYSVSVVDAYGSALTKINARSDDGKTLISELDLSKLPKNQKYRLCVSRAAEAPYCYLIALK